MTVLTLENIEKVYINENHRTQLVLKDVNVSIKEGEFVAIIGPSGCGKTTLLRLIKGLLKPTKGNLLFEDEPIKDINLNCSMVFQSFALLPWLTVSENVELALEATKMSAHQRRKKVAYYLHKVGLEGSEEAYPRELSGGMKQRVGFARALVMEPKVLLLDEPFSSLDTLTAISFREEILSLWKDEKIPVKTIILVTHMIEEAVELADRVLIFSSAPGTIEHNIPIDLPRPRNRKSKKFTQTIDRIFSLMV